MVRCLLSARSTVCFALCCIMTPSTPSGHLSWHLSFSQDEGSHQNPSAHGFHLFAMCYCNTVTAHAALDEDPPHSLYNYSLPLTTHEREWRSSPAGQIFPNCQPIARRSPTASRSAKTG